MRAACGAGAATWSSTPPATRRHECGRPVPRPPRRRIDLFLRDDRGAPRRRRPPGKDDGRATRPVSAHFGLGTCRYPGARSTVGRFRASQHRRCRMLNRVALNREQTYADVVIDFLPDADPSWPDLLEVSAKAASTRVRLRLHTDEIEILAVALDTAVTGGEGELYFRP